jgi:hypothetical protein
MEDSGELITTPAPRPAKQDRTTIALLFVAALVAVGGIGFAVGHLTAPSSAAQATFSRNRGGTLPGGGEFPGGGAGNFPTLAPGQTFNPGQLGNGNGGLRVGSSDVTGTVQSVNGSSMTVQLANGQTVTISLTGSTTYHGETAATADQVTVGSSVMVQVDTSALANETPNPAASGGLGGRQLSAKDVLITKP